MGVILCGQHSWKNVNMIVELGGERGVKVFIVNLHKKKRLVFQISPLSFYCPCAGDREMQLDAIYNL